MVKGETQILEADFSVRAVDVKKVLEANFSNEKNVAEVIVVESKNDGSRRQMIYARLKKAMRKRAAGIL